jgi:mannosyl-3-phosphoglycerate phosphatase
MELIIFSNLDGSLLDSATYSIAAARDALDALRSPKVPLILVPSKTYAEIEPVRRALGNRHPFVVENGGAIYLPERSFSVQSVESALCGEYRRGSFGIEYGTVRTALKDIEQTLGIPLYGFGDMKVEEIAERTDLSIQQARLARMREFDEPCVVAETGDVLGELLRQAQIRGFRCTQGGRFYHLSGGTTKGPHAGSSSISTASMAKSAVRNVCPSGSAIVAMICPC